VRRNLCREAQQRGVDPARLVFAGRAGMAEYLGRYKAADLFLDTMPFNAGTTASDALWAGLPLLTCAGKTFSARMAGSLLRAVDLPELITFNLHDYEEKAVALGQERERAKAMKQQLAEQRLTCALFDSPRFVRDLEDRLADLVAGNAPGRQAKGRTKAKSKGKAAPAAPAAPALKVAPLAAPATPAAASRAVPNRWAGGDAAVDDVLLILSSHDIPSAVRTAHGLSAWRAITFDPHLLGEIREAGLQQAEYIELEAHPSFDEMHNRARLGALDVERKLFAPVAHLLPGVSNFGWQHLNFYYLFLASTWYAEVGRWMAGRYRERFGEAMPHLYINDNPMTVYWPSFVPAVTVLEALNGGQLPFKAYSYEPRPDETNVVPMLLDLDGDRSGRWDVLTHLPTVFRDSDMIKQELAASGKSVINVTAKYWDIEMPSARNLGLVRTDDAIQRLPAALQQTIAGMVAQLEAGAERVLTPYLATPAFRERQARFFSSMYRSQLVMYFLLHDFFAGRAPRSMLLSDHDAGFLGPLVAYAEAEKIPVWFMPHSKTTPDIQFNRDTVRCLTHPIQGAPISDEHGRLTVSQKLAFPEHWSASSLPVGPVRKVGLLLNSLTLNGIPCTNFAVYMDGIRRIADWCRAQGVTLSVRGRPGHDLYFALEQATGLTQEELHAGLTVPLVQFASAQDVCLMYDAPTTAEIDFLRNGVPLLNPIPEPLAKYEYVIASTDVIPRASVEETLFVLGEFVSDPACLQRFRVRQFQRYVASFDGAMALSGLL
jgi:hypothetical protein